MDRFAKGRALVVGGGIAGLLAARVLAESHHEVQVLDRDELGPAGGNAPRRGVPQARHIHTILPRGRQVLEELFPGLTAQLVDAGAPTGDLLGDARLQLGGHRFTRAVAGLTTVSASRSFLESTVRARVAELPNVTFGPATDVLGLVTSPDGQQIRGVRTLRRADDSAEEVIDAAVVIDAMGRGSRTPTWLQHLGYEAPPEDHVAADVGYATRQYRLERRVLGDDWGTLQGPTVRCPRGGAMARIEGDRWIVTLFGLLGDHPPTDAEGFVGFAASLTFPDLYEAIRSAEPLDDPVANRFPASVRRRYERLRRAPVGLLPIGDALCSLNPIYGQGMTVAALQSLGLREHVRRNGIAEPRQWFRRAARLVDGPWDMAVAGDLAFPEVSGRRSPKVRLVDAYTALVRRAAAQDPKLAVAFTRVMSLVDPPTSLVGPATAVRLLRAARWADHDRGPPTGCPTPEEPAFDQHEEIRP